MAKAHLISEALQQGFECHHAEKDYVMLTQWLPSGENRLPPSASHQVGVGAFVLNQQREVLVVQEKHGPLRGKGVWKLPTGLVMQGEDVTAAAAREVLEETVRFMRLTKQCTPRMQQLEWCTSGNALLSHLIREWSPRLSGCLQ